MEAMATRVEVPRFSPVRCISSSRNVKRKSSVVLAIGKKTSTALVKENQTDVLRLTPVEHNRIVEDEQENEAEQEERPGKFSYLTDGKLDKFNRLRSPRAARELSLNVLYAGFVSEVHPLQVLEARMLEKKEPIDKEIMDKYEHVPVDGEPIYVGRESEARELEALQEEKARIDATVLTAHPYVVYNKFVLSLAQRIIKATSENWEKREYVVDQLLPSIWKDEGNGKLLETILMHMAIAEIEIVGTSPNIVINEAVELAKRYCDGFAPRTLNSCLGKYFRSRRTEKSLSPIAKELQASLSTSLYDSFGWKDEYED